MFSAHVFYVHDLFHCDICTTMFKIINALLLLLMNSQVKTGVNSFVNFILSKCMIAALKYDLIWF